MSGSEIPPEDRTAAKSLLTSITADARGACTSTTFDELLIASRVARATQGKSGLPRGHLMGAQEAYQVVLTSIGKVAWLTQQRDNGHLPEELWIYFCASDVVMFHVMARSLLDEI